MSLFRAHDLRMPFPYIARFLASLAYPQVDDIPERERGETSHTRANTYTYFRLCGQACRSIGLAMGLTCSGKSTYLAHWPRQADQWRLFDQ